MLGHKWVNISYRRNMIVITYLCGYHIQLLSINESPVNLLDVLPSIDFNKEFNSYVIICI